MSSGTLVAIHLHPVKSCRRVEVDRATVAVGGLAGDREWQVFSDDGKVLTQRRHPMLALVQPELLDGGLRLQAAGHGTVEAPRPERPDRVVCALLGDDVPVSVGGEESARWLSEL